MSSYCCAECFGDHGLRQSVIPSRAQARGTCDFCKARHVELVDPTELSAEFEMLTSIYEPSNEGKLLVQWLKEDWNLFPKLDLANSKSLLAEILDDGDIVRKNFIPSPFFKSEGLAAWTTLRDELMYKNRYFLDEALDKERLEVLLSHLTTSDLPGTWYRARISTSDIGYTLEQMGAPPRELASHGRANPSGIPYLYLGSAPNTAIAEIRPHTGEVASVAAFTLQGKITAVDLRTPRGLVSPFLLGDSSEVGRMRADVPFLERLGNELTRPVLPRSAAIDYLPSQYLCEFIKKIGYNGVIYRSSVSEGINLALFDPTRAIATDVSLYDVQRVSVEVGARQSD
jgi:hypothetical protein